MNIRKIFIINDLFQDNDLGRDQLLDFQSEYLKNYKVDAYYFVSTEDMKSQLDEAINNVIENKYDLVLLDVYFGTLGVRRDRLGIDYVLPELLRNNVRVILISALENPEIILNNISDIQSKGLVKYLRADELHLLEDYIKSFFILDPSNNAEINYGFNYRSEEEITKRNNVYKIFSGECKKIGSEEIELPLVAPVANFLGDPPRPLSSKFSQKLFSSVTPDGEALAVRYEGTVLAAKWISNLLKQNKRFTYKRLHYFQEMVRVEYSEELDSKHFRSFYQSGLELFASAEEYHILNIISLFEFIVNYFKSLNLEITLRLSHIDLVQKPLKEAKIESFLKRRVIGFLEKGEIDEIKEGLRLCNLPEFTETLLLDLAMQREIPLEKGIELLNKYGNYYEKALDEYRILYDQICKRGISHCFKFDPGIYRSLDFYSGIIFQGDLPNMRECLGGGEFTGLVESFGSKGPVYCIGMAAGVERLMNVLGD